MKDFRPLGSDAFPLDPPPPIDPLHYGLSGSPLTAWLSALRQVKPGLPREPVKIYDNLAGLVLTSKGLVSPVVCNTCKRHFACQYTIPDSVLIP